MKEQRKERAFAAVTALLIDWIFSLLTTYLCLKHLLPFVCDLINVCVCIWWIMHICIVSTGNIWGSVTVFHYHGISLHLHTDTCTQSHMMNKYCFWCEYDYMYIYKNRGLLRYRFFISYLIYVCFDIIAQLHHHSSVVTTILHHVKCACVCVCVFYDSVTIYKTETHKQ